MQRNHYFDFLRGIAIIMVVGIHTFSVEEVDMQTGFDVNVIIRQILNCAVPIFLAISGYFLYTKKLDTWNERKLFWQKQIPKVYVPTMIVSVPYFLLALMHGVNPFFSLLLMLACGYSIYYFIALILQYYALLPVFQKINRMGIIACTMTSLMSISIISYIMKIKGVELPLIVYAGPFPVWCVFFAMGCYLRKCRREYSLYFPIILLVICIALQYMETSFWNVNYGGGFGIKLSAFVYSMTVIAVLFATKTERLYKHNFITKAIEYIGSISFAIYLYHLFTTISFGMLHINQLPWLIRWSVCLVLTIVAIEILKKIVPNKYHWCFGV